ncbi:MAG: MarR family winged helix-turn-helix transcriptional regulator [Thiohalocapsa sp.]|jgi:DNA-binding MarR family transcriptional regulator|uniref:MarR family winged helix-turn-helix transcriptional regulator n=1 Tax=Thiohalocapsa sp. TaxID=2497641 RepID=UPI0025DE61B8|nr:MarR family winged helix-turn-helix transcriptional regulator [Thiohalocapsa sp.]MCG6941553.1 MarR family winged helix-turn-helix transcriptional regulator [Thiohalocapsa sp.]
MQQQEDSLGFLIADVYRLLRRAFQKRLEASSALTLAQAQTLVYISRNQGVRQVVIADMLDVQPITLARSIDQLAAAGLVERRPDPADRRAHLLHLTPEAAPQLAAIRDVGAAISAEALQGLTKDQVGTVLLALGQMRDQLTVRG